MGLKQDKSLTRISKEAVMLDFLLTSSKSRKSIFVPPVSENSDHSREDDRLSGSEQCCCMVIRTTSHIILPPIHPSVHSSIHPSTDPAIHPSICPSISLFIHSSCLLPGPLWAFCWFPAPLFTPWLVAGTMAPLIAGSLAHHWLCGSLVDPLAPCYSAPKEKSKTSNFGNF